MTAPAPPNWVSKRDGRLAPFDPDRISRALFAATAGLGRSDAFLARELADSAVHFLAQECEGRTPTTTEVGAVVAKVLRVLGQGELAAAFEEHRRRPSAADRLAAFRGAGDLYTPDLAAVRAAGLLTPAGTHAPDELAGCVVRPAGAGPDGLARALREAWRGAGEYVAIDGPEHLAAAGAAADDLAAAVRLTLPDDGRQVVVNLNSAAPPAWAGALAGGPLFADAAPADLTGRADELLDALVGSPAERVRVDWHLGGDDFAAGRVGRVARLALAGAPIGFVFDRPRRPVALAEGLDRGHPAALLRVGLHLPALAQQRGLLADADRFREALGSLARLALSAAAQKRARLRERRPDLAGGFLLDRARLVVVPVGLDEIVRQFTGWGLCNGGPSLELGRRLLDRLAEVLAEERRTRSLDACVDGPASFALEGAAAAGPTPWDVAAPPGSQLRAGGALHGRTGLGTLALFLPRATTPDDLAERLRFAWQQTEVVRLRVVPAEGRPPAPTGGAGG